MWIYINPAYAGIYIGAVLFLFVALLFLFVKVNDL